MRAKLERLEATAMLISLSSTVLTRNKDRVPPRLAEARYYCTTKCAGYSLDHCTKELPNVGSRLELRKSVARIHSLLRLPSQYLTQTLPVLATRRWACMDDCLGQEQFNPTWEL